jgi:hypothetical protein
MEFPELGKFLFKNYKPVVKNPAYAIFESDSDTEL